MSSEPLTPPGSRLPDLPAELAEIFRPLVSVRALDTDATSESVDVRVRVLGPRQSLDVAAEDVPLLVVPATQGVSGDRPRTVVVAVEGRDRQMAAEVTRLLEPMAVRLALVHVTWVPGVAPAPIDECGIDNPSPTDLLAYEGATEALVDTARALRDAGFVVSTHLRQGRHPAEELCEFVARRQPTLIVVGLHRHGEGIGSALARQTGRPVMFVEARGESH